MTSLSKTFWTGVLALAIAPAVVAQPIADATSPAPSGTSAAAVVAQMNAAWAAKHPEAPKLSELLQAGFEIKAAVPVSGYHGGSAAILLQKGKEAYQCSNAETTYTNTYVCAEVMDGEKRPPKF